MFNQLRTFPCPNCHEIINDKMEVCRFCSAPVDRNAAEAAAEIQQRVNQACSDSSYIKIAAVTMFIFLGLSLLPFLPVVEWGFFVTFFAVIVMIFRWQMKFSGIQTDDPDFQQAKRSQYISLALWVLAFPIGFIIRPLLSNIIYDLLF